jgi:hypothetical protein
MNLQTDPFPKEYNYIVMWLTEHLNTLTEDGEMEILESIRETFEEIPTVQIRLNELTLFKRPRGVCRMSPEEPLFEKLEKVVGHRLRSLKS